MKINFLGRQLMNLKIEDKILLLLQAEPLGKHVRISTFEICRLLNDKVNRQFCHKHRTSEKRKNGDYGGASNPTCDCSNDIIHCCQISWRQTYQTLLKMERKGIIRSSRRRLIDLKRMLTFVQISRDVYRLWEIRR